MDYGYLIKRAGQITWRYKFLWIFGIIMALCGQGSGGKPKIQMNYSSPMPFEPESGIPEFPAYFPEPLGQTPIAVYLVAGLLLALVFVAIGLVVGAICRSALIKSVARVEAGENINLAQSWNDGLAKAVPLGLLQALLYSPLFILVVIMVVIVFTQFWPFFGQILTSPYHFDGQGPPPFIEDIFTFLPLFFSTICMFACLFFIIKIMAVLFLTFGSRAIVLENKDIFGSFPRSWLLFRQNVGPTILLAIIMIAITIGVGIVIAIPTMIIMLPVMISTMPNVFSETGLSVMNYLLLGGVGLIVLIVFSFVNGVLQVFIEALGTLAYREFVIKASQMERP